jgi:hypothetical protein
MSLFYTPDAINFAQLGNANTSFADAEHHRNAIGLQHFLLAGDFFQQANKYSDFVDQLRDPKLFRRYQKYVMDRPDFHPQTGSSCEHTPEQIFAPTLAEFDRVRAERGI